MKNKKKIFDNDYGRESLEKLYKRYLPTKDRALALTIDLDKRDKRRIRKTLLKRFYKDIKFINKDFKRQRLAAKPLWYRILRTFLIYFSPPLVLLLIIIL